MFKFQAAVLIFMVMICGYTKLPAQTLERISGKLAQYGDQNVRSSLFVHFDKNVYTNNDQVWFTAYLLKSVTALSDYHTLYVSLVNNIDSTIVLQEKFLIDGGFAFGDMILPDSLPTGSYRFVVNTNIQVDGRIDGEFVQPVTIKSNTKNLLTPTISIFKAPDNQTGGGTAIVKVLTSDYRFVENADVTYTIGERKIIRKGRAKTNAIGELLIDYPATNVESDNNLLMVSVRKDHQLRQLKLELPVLGQQKYKVDFFPEGGYLVQGLTSRVGFEVKDFAYTPVETNAVLYEGDQAIDTIQTNDAGLGFFSFIPSIEHKYMLRLMTNGQDEYQFDLPEMLKEGVVVNAKDVIADNNLRVRLQASSDRKVHIVVHDYRNVLLHSEMSLKRNLVQQLRIELDSVPAGLHALTLLDHNFKPLAERIFFAHYNQLNRLQIKTDKENYLTRDSVKLNLQAVVKGQVLTGGLVSISCTQAGRFAPENNLNIVDYTFLEQLVKLPTHAMGMKLSDRDYLNEVLLIKGWRRFKWPRGEQDTLNNKGVVTSAEVTGQVYKGKHKLKAPVELTAIAGRNVNVLRTDATGGFRIPFTNLIEPDGKTGVWLKVAAKNPALYAVVLKDPVEDLNSQLQRRGYEAPTAKRLQFLDQYDLKDPKGNNLKEVVIKYKKDNEFSFWRYEHVNACGDYVCKNMILNCMNHFGDAQNKPPKNNSRYRTNDGDFTFYSGCLERKKDPDFSILKGIKLAKEFYKFDISNKEEPINVATIFWDHQRVLDADGKTGLTFNTGDLTGNFKIVVQGITSRGVIYGEKYITIKRP